MKADFLSVGLNLNHRRSQEGLGFHGPHKVLEYIVILCLERRYPKQNSVIRQKSKIFTPQIFGLVSIVKLVNSIKANFFLFVGLNLNTIVQEKTPETCTFNG